MSTSRPGDTPSDPTTHSDAYAYNDRGAMVFLPHLNSAVSANLVRDFRDQLRSADLSSTASAWYAYDAGGRRVRKQWIKNSGALIEERIYIGPYEVWRQRDGSGTLQEERQTLHVMDDERRIAMVETLTQTQGTQPTNVPRLRYQFNDHLGTATLEVDDDGGLITFEEYHPYGSVAWKAEKANLEVSAKRYRYTGMERDDETGLQLHGVRYYAPWLGRWCSADPIGLGDGPNRYAYVASSPTKFRDDTGRGKTPSQTENWPSQSDAWERHAAANEKRPEDTVKQRLRKALDAGLIELGSQIGALTDTGVNAISDPGGSLQWLWNQSAPGQYAKAWSARGTPQEGEVLQELQDRATLPFVIIEDTVVGALVGVANVPGLVHRIATGDSSPIDASDTLTDQSIAVTRGVEDAAALYSVYRLRQAAVARGRASTGPGRAEIGAAREARVAELTGGRGSGTARDLEFRATTTRPTRRGGTVTEPEGSKVDLVAPNGDHILVGGPAKSGKQSFMNDSLRQQRVARALGQEAHFYFQDTTPLTFLNEARAQLGFEFVHTFSMR